MLADGALAVAAFWDQAPLEGRVVLSLYASEFLVNSPTYSVLGREMNEGGANASSANGMSVVVWDHAFSATDHDIYAQLYDSSGRPKGGQITIDASGWDDTLPKVAMDAYGDFVVAWDRATGPGNSDVVARKFRSDGTPTSSTFYVANTTYNEYSASVAMDANGNFVVAYTFDFSSTDQDVVARRYDSACNSVQLISVATSTHAEFQPSVAMAPDGHFDIAYTYAWSSTDNDVRLNRYAADGTLLGVNWVAASGINEQWPSVAMDNYGNAVVAYQKGNVGAWDIKAVRVSSTGAQGGEINIARGLIPKSGDSECTVG